MPLRQTGEQRGLIMNVGTEVMNILDTLETAGPFDKPYFF